MKAFARLLRKTLREVDIIYRYGGEEFLVLLPETDAAGALLVAERLRKTVDSNVLTHRDNPSLKLRVTSSFGVSVNCEIDSGHLDIVKRADKALYNAKKWWPESSRQSFYKNLRILIQKMVKINASISDNYFDAPFRL